LTPAARRRSVEIDRSTMVAGLLPPGAMGVTNGKYVVIWKRDGGQWRIHRDIWNTSMPTTK